MRGRTTVSYSTDPSRKMPSRLWRSYKITNIVTKIFTSKDLDNRNRDVIPQGMSDAWSSVVVQVGSQTGEDTAAEFGLPFLEVSAKSGINVRDAFMSVATRAVGEHLVRKQFGKRRTRMAVKTTVESVPGLQVKQPQQQQQQQHH